MACSLAAQLRREEGFSLPLLVKAYQAWLPQAVDLDEQTKIALEAIASGVHHTRVGREQWMQSSRRMNGSAVLARTSPVGVFLSSRPDERIATALDDCALTHYDPRCQLACAALNGSLAAAIEKAGVATAETLWEAAQTDLALAAAELAKRSQADVLPTQDALEQLKADLAAARDDDPMLYGPELHLHAQPSPVRVAFRLAYWELLHAGSLKAALIDVANRGGASDVHGAVVGALFGAWQGEEAIPRRWQGPVLEAPRLGEHHPRALLKRLED